MAKEVISRCDKCGTSEDVREFRITQEGETRDVDLCTEHGAPVVEVFELGTPQQKPKARNARSQHAVIPIEDWMPEQG